MSYDLILRSNFAAAKLRLEGWATGTMLMSADGLWPARRAASEPQTYLRETMKQLRIDGSVGGGDAAAAETGPCESQRADRMQTLVKQ